MYYINYTKPSEQMAVETGNRHHTLRGFRHLEKSDVTPRYRSNRASVIGSVSSSSDRT